MKSPKMNRTAAGAWSFGLLAVAAGPAHAAATLPASGHYTADAVVVGVVPSGSSPCATGPGDTSQGQLALTTVSGKLQFVLRIPTTSGFTKELFKPSGGSRLNPSGTVDYTTETGDTIGSYGYTASYVPLDANSFSGRIQISEPDCTVIYQLVFIKTSAG